MATLILKIGMRCGEVYSLCRSSMWLEKGYLKVEKGKMATSVRRVYLSDRTREVLSRRVDKFRGENLFPGNDLDFAEPTGSLDKIHLQTARSLKMKFRLYDCRHTFASRAVEDGMDLLVLASILGHSNLKMVMGYAHP